MLKNKPAYHRVAVDHSSQPATMSLDGQEILTLQPGDHVEIREGTERVLVLWGGT